MKKKLNKNWIYSIGSLIVLAFIAILYNMPIFSGNQALLQPDIVNYKGSAQEMLVYQEKTHQNTYWSDAMFGGMPTYQTGAKYDYNIVKSIDKVIRFLPRPADYLFILFLGFFILGITLFKQWKYALLGAILFGLGTYFFIVIEAGHNSKIHAVAYFAPLMAGIILLFKKKYLSGFLLTVLSMALELNANHPQMTYYFGFVVLLYIIFEGGEALKKKNLKAFFRSSILSVVAVILAMGLNSTNYLATYEYGKESTRGKNTITLLQNEKSNHSGLDKDYITMWSYGKLETLNLFIPNFMGGGSSGTDPYKKNLQKAIPLAAGEMASQYTAQDKSLNFQEVQAQIAHQMQGYIQGIPTYWGQQPFTSGPAYQGAVVVFLFILGLFLVKGKCKWWLLSATTLSILLAWGHNLMWLSDFFIDYIPFYDKFRAVSSILVIAEFTMPLLATMAVYRFFKDETLTKRFKQKVLYYAGGSVVLLLFIFYFAGGTLFSFHSDIDTQLPSALVKGIKEDRISMFKEDTLRTLVFVVLSLGLLILYHLKILKNSLMVILGLAFLSLIDLWGIDKRYLNDEDFIPKQWVEHPFPTQMSERMWQAAQNNSAVRQIAYRIPINQTLAELKKKDSTHFRVFNQTTSTFNDASTSYFVPSVGGYHGAKLQNYQNIIDIYFSQDSLQNTKLGIKNHAYLNILNMLNTKYFIGGDAQQPQVIENPERLGNAWFVDEVILAKDDNDAILKIGAINAKKQAVLINTDNIKAIKSEGASLKLKHYLPNRLTYESNNSNPGFAVFSEVYYPKGWVATIDGTPANIIKTNYFLRGLSIPAGKHTIVFQFEPKSVRLGNKITLASNILLFLIILGAVGYYFKNKKSFLSKKGR